MTKTFSLFLLAGFAGCATAVCPEELDGPDHDFTPTTTRTQFRNGVPVDEPFDCRAIHHPGLCPFVAFEQRATLAELSDGRVALSLWATRDLSEGVVLIPLAEPEDLPGCLADSGTSDATGLRHPLLMCPDGDGGWLGSVEWTLRAFAGRMRVDFEIR